MPSPTADPTLAMMNDHLVGHLGRSFGFERVVLTLIGTSNYRMDLPARHDFVKRAQACERDAVNAEIHLPVCHSSNDRACKNTSGKNVQLRGMQFREIYMLRYLVARGSTVSAAPIAA